MRKALYFLGCLGKRLFRPESMKCPNCHGEPDSILDRKHLVATLARCRGCRLLFRQPTTPPKVARTFYQSTYSQGYTTDVPNRADLDTMISASFIGTERDYTRFIDLFGAIGVRQGARVLEFGCSWGYGAWQLREAGYEVEAFDVSQPRCSYAANELGIPAKWQMEDIQGSFDLIFSSHVIEHVDDISGIMEWMTSKLRPGGLMVHVTPNGSLHHRNHSPLVWHLLWGEVHPQLIDEEFCQTRFKKEGFFITSNPYDYSELKIRSSEGKLFQGAYGPLNGDEILIIVKK